MRKLFLVPLLFIGACCAKKEPVVQTPPALTTVQPAEQPCDGCDKTPEAPLGGGFGTALPKEAPDKQTFVTLKPVYFATNSAALSKQAIKTLDEAAAFFQSQNVQEIILYGHCDERGSRKYNYELGRRRVNSVAIYLNRKLNRPSYEVHSLGEDSPVCTLKNEQCWSKNRRVELQALMP